MLTEAALVVPILPVKYFEHIASSSWIVQFGFRQVSFIWVAWTDHSFERQNDRPKRLLSGRHGNGLFQRWPNNFPTQLRLAAFLLIHAVKDRACIQP